MFTDDDLVIPSSPITLDKASIDEILNECFSYDCGIISPNSISREYIPKTEDVVPISISIVRLLQYTPLIKQVSDCGYSQPDYVYTTSSGLENQSNMFVDQPLFSTPRSQPWRDMFFDVNLRSSSVTDIPGFPGENSKELPQKAFGTALETKKCLENMADTVKILRPIPRRNHFCAVSSVPADPPRQKTSFPVKLRFHRLKPFLRVVALSGPEREYNLPIFSKLMSLDAMLLSGKYNSLEKAHRNTQEKPQTYGKRYASRLTRSQLGVVLGLEGYDDTLIKDIENIVLGLCTQLCGIKLGESSWSRNVPGPMRKASIIKVHKFMQLYFPSFTQENVQTIMGRGAYARTQEFLRRKRRREKKLMVQSRLACWGES